MNYKIVWLPNAIQEMQEIRISIEKRHGPEVANKVIKALLELIDMIGALPFVYQRDTDNPKFRRVVVMIAFIVYFRVSADMVQIIYIKHLLRTQPEIEEW